MTDIMEACIHGSKKTRIMYSANLSYELTKKYVADMLNAGLLMKREVEEGEMYFLTEKGRNVLDKLKKYKSLRQELHKLNDELRGLHKLNDELRRNLRR